MVCGDGVKTIRGYDSRLSTLPGESIRICKPAHQTRAAIDSQSLAT